jgi:cell division cycle protein 20 (cofactor of APC complex)
MEDLINFQASSNANDVTSMLNCSPQRSLSNVNFPLDTWATIGSKRHLPDEPFSSKKRKKEEEDVGPNKIIESALQSSLPSAPKTPSSSKKSRDRFIPNRCGLDIDYNFYQLMKPPEAELDVKLTPSQRKLKDELNNIKSADKRRIMECRSTLTPQFDRVATPRRMGVCIEHESKSGKRQPRSIPTTAFKTLDAPDLLNDYYLNLLHWGSSNILSIALGGTVYLWHPENGHTESIVELEAPNSYVSSVQWSGDGKTLAVGTSFNTVQLWDVGRMSMIREMEGHQSRVSCLAWNCGSSSDVLSSGGKDSIIINHDIRAARNAYALFAGHTQEVCGLSWSPSGETLVC